jgi:transcriptional regulator GlxA family with amidase domain
MIASGGQAQAAAKPTRAHDQNFTQFEMAPSTRRLTPVVYDEAGLARNTAALPFYSVTAGFDLCLSFVEADCGPEIALKVARNLVLFMRRPGGQTQYSAALKVQTAATPAIRKLIGQISSDPTGDLSLPALADRASMSERTFSRVFHKETGVTPAAFVEIARVDRAKALLETSSWPLARVAERAGLNSLDALHRAFQKRVGVTPGEYRQRFGQRG